MAWAYYAAGIVLAFVVLVMVPAPFNIAIAVGLAFGWMWTISEKVSKLEARLRPTEPADDSADQTDEEPPAER